MKSQRHEVDLSQLRVCDPFANLVDPWIESAFHGEWDYTIRPSWED